MTQALYNRLDAIESFAADVAHELKNPLTSLRSALETLPRVKSGPARDRLVAVMQHDVRRLDRLISDISDASRLDAELARGDAGPVDVAALLQRRRLDVAGFAAQQRRADRAVDSCETRPARRRGLFRARPRFASGAGRDQSDRQRVLVFGTGRRRAGRARAEFDGTGRRAARGALVITVDDDGPGIPPHALERIFERFYTDRPNQGFGQNSGLGLSISRQIVEAHGGRIWAANRPAETRPSGSSNRALTSPRRAGPAWRRRPLRRRTAGVRGMSGRSRDCTLRRSSIGENGVLMLGPSGSGKSASCSGLARARARSRPFRAR